MEKKFSDSDEPDFQSSILGTKEFWESSFKRDLHVYKERLEIDDIWFGQESVDRVLKWLDDNDVDKSSSIIDIGCGNGATLLALASEGYTNLCGIDYAASAIHLATTVCASQQQNIHFQECDFLQDFTNLTLEGSKNDEPAKEITSDFTFNAANNIITNSDKTDTAVSPNKTIKNNIKEDESKDDNIENEAVNTYVNETNNATATNTTTTTNVTNNTETNTTTTPNRNIFKSSFDICLDKGTYDAICLNPENRSVMKGRYQANMAKICKDGGLFIITSCNWTRDELIKQFCDNFELVHQIPTPMFKFGGRVGNGEAVLVLKKIAKDI